MLQTNEEITHFLEKWHKIIENDLLVNIDETGLFLNLVFNNTINKAGEKNILIKTNGQ